MLIGTQMVAKGHDFPGVPLVGVVAADVGLHLPDFRAAERTFQLLTQVAGRAGRDRAPGRVIVQTFVPDHYAVRPGARPRLRDVLRAGARAPRALGFPPLGHARERARLRGAARATRSRARRRSRAAIAAAGACELLGPAPAPLPRLRGRHRQQLLIKGERDAVRSAARAPRSPRPRGCARACRPRSTCVPGACSDFRYVLARDGAPTRPAIPGQAAARRRAADRDDHATSCASSPRTCAR